MIKEGQLERQAKATPNSFRPVEIEVERERAADIASDPMFAKLRDTDAKVVGAITTIFHVWRKIFGFIVLTAGKIDEIEQRLYRHNQKILELESTIKNQKCAECEANAKKSD